MANDNKSAIEAIGALCEISGFMYKQLIKNGLSEQRAFEIVAEYILTTMSGNNKNQEDLYE